MFCHATGSSSSPSHKMRQIKAARWLTAVFRLELIARGVANFGVQANGICVKGLVTTVSLSTMGDGTGVGVIGSCRFEVQNTK